MSISKMLQELLGDVDLQEFSARATRELNIDETLNQIRNIDFTKLWDEAQARAAKAEEQRKREKDEYTKELMRRLMEQQDRNQKSKTNDEESSIAYLNRVNKDLNESNDRLTAALQAECENAKILRDTMATAIELIEALELRQAITYLQWGVERKGSSDADS